MLKIALLVALVFVIACTIEDVGVSEQAPKESDEGLLKLPSEGSDSSPPPLPEDDSDMPPSFG